MKGNKGPGVGKGYEEDAVLLRAEEEEDRSEREERDGLGRERRQPHSLPNRKINERVSHQKRHQIEEKVKEGKSELQKCE